MTPLFRRRLQALLVTMTVLLVADQVTKFLAVRHLTPSISQGIERGEVSAGFFSELGYFYSAVRDPCRAQLCSEVTVVDGFWTFHYRENRGAAFSLFAKASDTIRVPFFVITTLLALGFIVTYLRRIGPEKRVLTVALVLVASGAIGNLVDRLYLGYVIDFIHWYVGRYSWPTFNVADSAITVGAVLLAIDALFLSKDEKAAEASEKKSDAKKSAAKKSAAAR